MQKKFVYCPEFCLRNAELMEARSVQATCLRRRCACIGAREEIEKRAVADNARIATLGKMACDEMVQIGPARTEQRFGIYRFTLLSA